MAKRIVPKEKVLNRLKIILAQKSKTNLWLAEQMGKNIATVSEWCTNTKQPKLENLYKIARILDVEVRKLIVPTKEKED